MVLPSSVVSLNCTSRPFTRDEKMAEVNTGTKEEKFVFGQNMEDRAIKPAADAKEDSPKTENGAETGKRPMQSPLRPSAFRPSGGILAPSRLGSNPFVHRSAAANNTPQEVSLKTNPFAAIGNHSSSVSSAAEPDASSGKMILKPSALDRQTANFGRNTGSAAGASSNYKSTFKLEPAKLQNPLNQPKVDHKENIEEGDTSAPSGEAPSERVEDDPASSAASPDKGASPESKGAEGGATDVSSTTPTKDDKSKNAAFVFGQNMEKRVANASGSQQLPAAPSFVFGERVADRISGVGATSPPPDNDKEKPTSVADGDSSTQTLVESAAAHQAKQTRPELQEVDLTTGEENESNVFQINAKLFAFESPTQSWLERGRGLLRLNDMSATNKQAFQSRLVMRTQGSLRVILNTKVWAGMMVERASQKSVRVTACEGDKDVKVFLIMANPKDADQILSAIDWRVQQQKKLESEQTATQEKQETHKAPPAQESQPEKRHAEPEETTVPVKRARMEPTQRREMPTEESNDSSTLDPETEVSNESFTSTTKSSSSE